MRLNTKQREALEKVLEKVEGEVYLFSSRIDDTKKGGDIDILILSEGDPFEISRNVSTKFFMECEEKIDVIVMSPNKYNQEEEAFLKVIEKIRIK